MHSVAIDHSYFLDSGNLIFQSQLLDPTENIQTKFSEAVTLVAIDDHFS